MNDKTYQNRKHYDQWLEFTDSRGLEQLIKTPHGREKQWISKIVNTGSLYSRDEQEIKAINFEVGDHLGIEATLKFQEETVASKIKNKVYVCDWTKYTKEKYQSLLTGISWEKYSYMNAQQISDTLDQDLLTTLQMLAPEILIKSDRKRHVLVSEAN